MLPRFSIVEIMNNNNINLQNINQRHNNPNAMIIDNINNNINNDNNNNNIINNNINNNILPNNQNSLNELSEKTNNKLIIKLINKIYRIN